MGRCTFTTIALFAAVSALAQLPAPTAFEVAAIKPTKEGFGSAGWDTRADGITLRGQTLKSLIVIAYRVTDLQVSGGPKWLDGDRFDINAKATSAVAYPQLLIMLQTLLKERFQLAVHNEQKSVSGYALTSNKSGLKIQPIEAGKVSPSNSYSNGRLSARAITMAQLATTLSRLLHSPVSDLTGATGSFDVQLDLSKADNTADSTDFASVVADALEAQIGLILEVRKVSMDLIVVDKAEKPTFD